MTETGMRRALVLSDSVRAKTGFASVVRTVLSAIADWEVVQVGLNHPGGPALGAAGPGGPVLGPLCILPEKDPDRAAEVAFSLYRQERFDLFLIVQDLHVAAPWAHGLSALGALGRGGCPIVYLFPVDGPMAGMRRQVAELLASVDRAVTCTEWGRDMLTGIADVERIEVIPHDVDTRVFYPLEPSRREALKRKVYGVGPDVLTVAVVATNTIRKDLYMAMCSVREAVRQLGRGSVKLYLHTPPVFQGMDVRAQAEAAGLVLGLDYQIADRTTLWAEAGLLRELYAASDCVLFTSRREGWGLPMTEAMACRTAVVAPRYGPFEEVLKDSRGYLYEPISQVWTDRDLRGPGWLADPRAAGAALLQIAQNRGRRPHGERLDEALAFVREELDSSVVAARWKEVLCGSC